MTTKAIGQRLARLEAARQAEQAGLLIADWIAAYRAGASIAERNAAAGPAWVAMALERHGLAEQTMVDYAQSPDYTPNF